MATNPSSFLYQWLGQMAVCDSPSMLKTTLSKLDPKGLALTKARMIVYSSWSLWPWAFNFLACTIEIIYCSNTRSVFFSSEKDHLALLKANCWFIFELTSQQKSKIAKCLSVKTKLHCLLTHKHFCCDTKPAESILKKNIASKIWNLC